MALTVCGRLNWQLHFGEPPKWAAGVKFILVDIAPQERDCGLAAVVLQGDAAAVTSQLQHALGRQRLDLRSSVREWKQQLHDKVRSASGGRWALCPNGFP